MNNKKNRCVHCNFVFSPAAHVKNQKHCSKKKCQQARKNSWMRCKLKSDKDYGDNQKTYWSEWKKRNYGYWKRRKNQPKNAECASKDNPNKKPKQRRTAQATITLELLPSNKQALYELVNNKKISCQLRLI